MSNRAKISASIHTNVLNLIINSDKPVSTLEICARINRAWHSVQNHCLKLQIEGKITGFKVGNMNLWVKASKK
ncbi:MAG TPA: hypothetical protein VJI97_04930 [Candidatus Nanoarchaeia archaeon]|nr:hypothetical protein [Candidatus Nanoarchaeia archaeon]